MKIDRLVEKFISVDPSICHGKPCLAGTRVMVYQILEHVEAGETPQEIQKHYPRITMNHIKAAIRYATRLLRDQEFIPFNEAS